MALPPQLNNILARMESIETCPRCGRLVYRKELLDQGDAATRDATKPDAAKPDAAKPDAAKPDAAKSDAAQAAAPKP